MNISQIWSYYDRAVALIRRKAKREAAALALRDRLIAEHMVLAEKIAHKEGKAYCPPFDMADLVAAGRVGLVEAANRYTPDKGVFSHYAYFRIRGAVIDARRRRPYREELHSSIEEMRERLGFLPHRLETDTGPEPDELAEQREQRRQLARAIDWLPTAEKRVLLAHLASKSLATTAADLHMPVMQVRETLAAARIHVTSAARAMPGYLPAREREAA